MENKGIGATDVTLHDKYANVASKHSGLALCSFGEQGMRVALPMDRSIHPDILLSPPVHKCVGFFICLQDSMTVDHKLLEEPDKQLQHLEQVDLPAPGLQVSSTSDEKRLDSKLNSEIINATSGMPVSFYQHLPDWDQQNKRQKGCRLPSRSIRFHQVVRTRFGNSLLVCFLLQITCLN